MRAFAPIASNEPSAATGAPSDTIRCPDYDCDDFVRMPALNSHEVSSRRRATSNTRTTRGAVRRLLVKSPSDCAANCSAEIAGRRISSSLELEPFVGRMLAELKSAWLVADRQSAVTSAAFFIVCIMQLTFLNVLDRIGANHGRRQTEK